MRVRRFLGNLRRSVLINCHRRIMPFSPGRPIVTFSFDDFPRSAVTAGAEILEKFGARGTYYVAMSLMNRSNALGEQFCLDDLLLLVERGHEIASHTFSHFSARQMSSNAFEQDAEKGSRAIREAGFTLSGNFAYPYGEVTLRTKRKLGLKFTSCRGTIAGLNGPLIDMNLLRANRLYGGKDHDDVAKLLVLENEMLGSWLIFYTHDVSPEPSPFGCTPQLLEHVCSLAAAHNARFMTVAQVMLELEQGKSATGIEFQSENRDSRALVSHE